MKIHLSKADFILRTFRGDVGAPRDVVARLLGEQDRKRFSRWAAFSHRWCCVPDPSAKRKDQTEGGELRLSLTFQKLDQ